MISTFGLIGILALVFAESGLLIGFFLPGDSLLFATGLLIAAGRYLHSPLWLVCLLIASAAIAGDQLGYTFGKRVGPALFRRPNSRLLRQENLQRAQRFFDTYGARSLVLARFVPIVRTFTDRGRRQPDALPHLPHTSNLFSSVSSRSRSCRSRWRCSGAGVAATPLARRPRPVPPGTTTRNRSTGTGERGAATG